MEDQVWEEQRKVSFAPVGFDVPAEHLGRCGRLELKLKVENTQSWWGPTAFKIVSKGLPKVCRERVQSQMCVDQGQLQEAPRHHRQAEKQHTGRELRNHRRGSSPWKRGHGNQQLGVSINTAKPNSSRTERFPPELTSMREPFFCGGAVWPPACRGFRK